MSKKPEPSEGGDACERPGRSRNTLYTVAAEFKARNPRATALDAWRHFTSLVGCAPHLVNYDSQKDALAYLANDRDIRPRWVKRRSFEQAYFRIRNR